MELSKQGLGITVYENRAYSKQGWDAHTIIIHSNNRIFNILNIYKENKIL